MKKNVIQNTTFLLFWKMVPNVGPYEKHEKNGKKNQHKIIITQFIFTVNMLM